MLHLWAVPFDQNDPTINDPVVLGDPNIDEGFSVRRARMSVRGQFSDSTDFGIQLGYERPFSGTEEGEDYPSLEEGYVRFHRGNLPGFQVGVSKVPFGGQQWVSSKRLLLIERSITSETLTFGRDVGLTMYGDLAKGSPEGFGLQNLEYWLGVYNGSDSVFKDDNGLGDVVYTGIDAPANLRTNPFGLLQVIRIQADMGSMGLGSSEIGLDHGSFNDVTVRLGLNAAGNRALESRTVAYGGDLGMYAGPLALQFEAIWNTTMAQYSGEGTVDVYDQVAGFGWYVQAGYTVIPQRLQLALRYEFFDGNVLFEDADDLASVSMGLNYYPFKHDGFKLQANYVRRMERAESVGINNDSLYMNIGMYFWEGG